MLSSPSTSIDASKTTGGVFALLMTLTTYLLERYFSEAQGSEMYLTAKRSIKTGLITSSVVSSWTLSATLLTSTTFRYSYGIAATLWLGAGCSVPILTFAVLAIELKRKAPNAHTFLELVKHRYGASGHVVPGIFPLSYQVFIAFNLLVGGVDASNLVTGMKQGRRIKATFLTEWMLHLSIWELLKPAAEIRPVDGNAGNEFPTLRSFYGGLAGLIFLRWWIIGDSRFATLSKGHSSGPQANCAYPRSGVISIDTLLDFISTVAGKNNDFEEFKELKQVDGTALAIDIKDGHLPVKTAVEMIEEEL
ncbi:putative Urea active transporter [Seiridium unicorne]|uniref:Urea active transporter n=1 Tax=Seiridium unicorne TaxID=138068 RepID=A0ABR2UGE7_9PEZI